MRNEPRWVKSVPATGTHGSGKLQKRLWRLVSDYVRIRDWHKYNGRCVATPRRIERWQDGDAGHFRPYSICNAMFKFDPRNIFLQSKKSNGFGEYDDWIAFEKEVIRRTGMNRLAFDKLNLSYARTTINDSKVFEQMKEMIRLLGELPEQPDYYERVMEHYEAVQE